LKKRHVLCLVRKKGTAFPSYDWRKGIEGKKDAVVGRLSSSMKLLSGGGGKGGVAAPEGEESRKVRHGQLSEEKKVFLLRGRILKKRRTAMSL